MEDILINNIIERYRNDNELPEDCDIFSIFSISQLFRNSNISLEDIDESIFDGGGDGGMDSILIFIDGTLITTNDELQELIESKYFTSNTRLDIHIIQIKENTKYKEEVWQKIITTFMLMYEETAIEHNLSHEAYAKFSLVKSCIDSIMSYSNFIALSVYYVNKGLTENVSEGVRNKGLLLRERIMKNTLIKDVNIIYKGARELREIYNTPINISLQIKYTKMLEKSYKSDDNSSFIVLTKLNEYYKFITEDNNIRENILESNIRHFEGSVEVNKEIIDTLNNHSTLDFWELNNGITILADQITLITNNRIKMENVQIINGLQTTYCIYNYLKRNPNLEMEDRSVLVKIIHVQNPIDSDKIIKSTNSQTPIRSAELRATDQYQRDIESSFIAKGYYYERRKNYYKNTGKPQSKIFSIAKTAQFIEAIVFGNSGIARNNPTSLLKNDSNYKRIFNSDHDISIYLTCCLLFSQTKNIIKGMKKLNDPIHNLYNVDIDIFYFHLAYLVSRILTNNNSSISNLNKIEISRINNNVCTFAIEMLIESIKKVGEGNIINISKSKELDAQIKNELSSMRIPPEIL